uniref:1-phosphatidylinositol-3-phosphate 5-kinase n=2 Tax=Ascaris TaxID=6251 RepID=F1KR02_ASCSU
MEVSAADGGITYFARLPAELEKEASTSNGILGNLFGRFFSGAKEDSDVADETSRSSEEVQTGETISHEDVKEPDNCSTVSDNASGRNEETEAEGSNGPAGSVAKRKLSTRLSSLFRSRRPSLVDYNRSDIRRYWMPDSTGRECYECQERFTTFRRRHHCRLCGQIFCSKCCSIQVPGSLLGYMGDLRLCAYCARIVMSYLPQIESTSDSITVSTPAERNAGGKCDADTLISTVSTGPMIWEAPTPSMVLESSPTSTAAVTAEESSVVRQQPSLLSVTDLAMQQERGVPSAAHTMSSTSVDRFCSGVDDCEPEWVRSIEMFNDSGKRNESFIKTDDLNSSRSLCFLDGICDDRLNGTISSEEESFRSSASSRPKFDVTESPPIGADLERSFEDRAQKLLLYLFERELLDPALWWDVIWPVSRRVSSLVRVDVEGRKDHINMLKYVHVKKLCVEEKPSATVIEGIVCSKSVTHGSMPRYIQNAAVMALAGSVEYERVPGKLSSIDAIIAQESDYLSKQVERILAQRPSVLLVEQNVARLAVELLLKAGVTLVSNIKSQVLHRVARSTRADVMPSLDAQLLQQKIGFSPVFKQQKVRLANGTSKTLLVFSDCPAELGCSVVLKGRSMRELRAAKRILRHMVLALYSSRLELELLSMFGASVAQRSPDCLVCSLNADETDSDPESFMHRLKECTLSASPLINFGVPFLETAKGRRCVLRPYFKHPLYRFSTKADFEAARRRVEQEERETESNKLVEEASGRMHPFVCNQELGEVSDEELASFRATSGLIFSERLSEKSTQKSEEKSLDCLNRHEDVLDPFIHQRIAVLFGSFSAKSPNAPLFCVRPWVVQMEHYGNNDMCLGEFLKKFCFNKDYQCPSTNCDVPMLDHSRKMVYRKVCVEIVTQSCVLPVDDGLSVSHSIAEQTGTLLAWHYCPGCKASSNVVPLSDSVVHLSFARFLDYLANGMFATCSVASFNRECTHCCFHQHDHYFALNNYVACFKVHPVRPYHVMFSPVVCAVEPLMFTRKFVAETEDEIRKTADAVFKVMHSQLERFTKAADYQRYSSFYTLLSTLLQEAQTNFSDVLSRFDVNGALKSGGLTIRSNDGVYIQAMDTITRCRYIVQHMIEQWNEQSTRLAQSVRAFKKSASSSLISPVPHQASAAPTSDCGDTTKGEHSSESNELASTEETAAAGLVPPSTTEVELTSVDSPFLSQLHFALPFTMSGVTTVVRDLVDHKGTVHPDIGSIVAYALSSSEYEAKRKNMREIRSSNGVPITLRNSATENDIAGNYEHIELDFADDRAQYFVKIYYAERFHMLRKLLFVEGEDCFVRSLSVSAKWNPQGGKSGASFYRTQDDRFVFKQMSRFEIQSFVKFAPNYFDYVSTAVIENKLTTLCKVYGVYRVGYKNKCTGQQLKLDVLVMEYLFYKRNVKQVWDLKGSQRNRMASEGKRTTDLVLLDENLVKDLWNNQLYVHPHSKAALSMAISNDSHFLSAQHVMDYSLLVGVDAANDELILGIVDYMRTYTLDKKLESWVKIVAIPGAHLPTVISPEMYCARFSDAIDTYFPVTPDQWTALGSAMSY